MPFMHPGPSGAPQQTRRLPVTSVHVSLASCEGTGKPARVATGTGASVFEHAPSQATAIIVIDVAIGPLRACGSTMRHLVLTNAHDAGAGRRVKAKGRKAIP